LKKELDLIGVKLRRHKPLKGKIVLTRFFKKGFIYQLVNVLIVLLFYPITAHYFRFLLPQFGVTPPDIWTVQIRVFMPEGLIAPQLSVFMKIRAQKKR
jgi:hypothetical protein